VRVHFSRPDQKRFVSAADVLAGKVDPHVLERKLVLIGVTALGLSDYQMTPVADRMPGVEIHAQLLENIFDSALLTRPRSIVWIEMAFSLLVGVAMLWVVDRAAVWVSLMIAASLVAPLVVVPMGIFRSYGILLDPIPAIVAVFALLVQQSLVKLNRLGRLRRFFSPQLAKLILAGGAADPLNSHRREVTVVFLDLRGFTTPSPRRPILRRS
jgi:adenylate cyclase